MSLKRRKSLGITISETSDWDDRNRLVHACRRSKAWTGIIRQSLSSYSVTGNASGLSLITLDKGRPKRKFPIYFGKACERISSRSPVANIGDFARVTVN